MDLLELLEAKFKLELDTDSPKISEEEKDKLVSIWFEIIDEPYYMWLFEQLYSDIPSGSKKDWIKLLFNIINKEIKPTLRYHSIKTPWIRPITFKSIHKITYDELLSLITKLHNNDIGRKDFTQQFRTCMN